MKTSWKTTALGISTILVALGNAAALLLDSDPNTNPDYTLLITTITNGIGLCFARDNNKTSEQVGAK